jgi:hypothetical protein
VSILTPSHNIHTETSIDRLSKKWDAPVYVFFKAPPTVQYFNNRKAHVFECAASPCRNKTKSVRRFLYTGDTSSTSNLRRHARLCWGDEALDAADETRDIKTAREALANHKGLNGSITAAFKRVGTGAVTYSHRQHTKIEARYVPILYLTVTISNVRDRAEFVRWVTENKRPFQIVNDRGFRCITKTGRPGYYIPSAETLSRDVRNVFVRVRERIANSLQVCDNTIGIILY